MTSPYFKSLLLKSFLSDLPLEDMTVILPCYRLKKSKLGMVLGLWLPFFLPMPIGGFWTDSPISDFYLRDLFGVPAVIKAPLPRYCLEPILPSSRLSTPNWFLALGEFKESLSFDSFKMLTIFFYLLDSSMVDCSCNLFNWGKSEAILFSLACLAWSLIRSISLAFSLAPLSIISLPIRFSSSV